MERPYGCMHGVFVSVCVCVGGCVCVCQTVKLLVHALCIVHIFLMQRQIGFACGMLMPYYVGNIMLVCMLVSKVIKGVLLDETLR